MRRSLQIILIVSVGCSTCSQRQQATPDNSTTQSTSANPTTMDSNEELKTFLSSVQAQNREWKKRCLSETNLEKAQPILDAIANGKLIPDNQGVAILPPEHRALTVDGNIYVTAVNGKPMAILFTNWVGRDRNFNGYLYYRGSLDALGRRNGDEGLTIEIVIQSVPPSPSIEAEWLPVHCEATKTANWYHVWYSLD
jgi:hypothetical protein